MKWKHKSWVTIWLILVCAALLVTGTYAAYTKVEYVKRVVASKNQTETVLFSSNYLSQRESSSQTYPTRMIPVGTQSDASVTVTVCNYPQSDLTRVNEETITYTLTASLVDINDNPITAETIITYQDAEGNQATITGEELAEKIKINDTPFNSTNITYSAEGTLTGGTAQSQFYKITCGKDDIPILSAISIRMQAVPHDNNIGMKLMGQLRLGTNYQQKTTWTGTFSGLTEPTTDHDAFNYEISGTMEQTMRLSWNPARVTLGRWSRMELSIPEDNSKLQTEGDMVYYDIEVGATDAPTSYTLQFYRVGGIPADETAAVVRGYVSFEPAPESGS